MQGDQIVPYKGAALLRVKLLKRPTLKLYAVFLHVGSDMIKEDLLALSSRESQARHSIDAA